MAISADHGQTFSAPRAVTDHLSCGDTPANRKVRIMPQNIPLIERWEDGGDYIGIAAAADRTFHLVWPDTRGGTFQTYTAQVRLEE